MFHYGCGVIDEYYISHNTFKLMANVAINYAIVVLMAEMSFLLNRQPHYDEIMRQVAAGTLTIQDAD